jgi:hypothetical protein
MDDYAFKLVDVDLSNGETEITTIGSETIQRFIGATGSTWPNKAKREAFTGMTKDEDPPFWKSTPTS